MQVSKFLYNPNKSNLTLALALISLATAVIPFIFQSNNSKDLTQFFSLTQKEEPSVVINGEVTVRDWRHRIQRAFLGKSDVNEKMMPDINEVFKSIEAFEMKMEWLTSSKLGKVLKQVGALDNSKMYRAVQKPLQTVDKRIRKIPNRLKSVQKIVQRWKLLYPRLKLKMRLLPQRWTLKSKTGWKLILLTTQKDKGRGDAHRTGMAVVSNKDEKKDDDTEAKDQEKGDLKAAEGKSDKDEIKEDGEKDGLL
ncbi:hypothetical protein PPACK8108_LOCUS6387 [Phakopsora pachyrhizi]|uniref:Uncharacterized protein n=1 Tax=Phakopsora pachyrhizi TaxID=170000 RepID=A0AAV0AS64_PHAPC|nr:hypothetical protein PPACK8108_LOCUS6387 [Phakopsora pachyrhizi]